MLVLYHSRVLKQWDFRLRLELLRRLDDHGAEDAGSVVGAFAGAHADGLLSEPCKGSNRQVRLHLGLKNFHKVINLVQISDG